MNNQEEIQPLLSAYECGILSLEQSKSVEAHVLDAFLSDGTRTASSKVSEVRLK